MGRHRDNGRGELPLRRLRTDSKLWAKVAALWHRERAKETYGSAGYPRHVARKLANREALRVAQEHGWRGELGQLKTQLSDLFDPKAIVTRSTPRGTYWEDVVRTDMQRLLELPVPELRERLREYVQAEVALRGPFVGQVGLYKLAYLIAFVPPMEHERKRSAFIEVLTEVGRDPDYCDGYMFTTLFRLLRHQTLRPFESRLGFSMPEDPGQGHGRRSGWRGLTRWWGRRPSDGDPRS